MNNDDLIQLLNEYKNPDRAIKMAAYMRNQFDFLGIPASLRKELTKPFLKEAKDNGTVDWSLLTELVNGSYREYQYIASDYLNTMQSHLVPEDLPKIKALVLTKPWWDTIDSLDKVIGKLALKYPELNEKLIEWSVEESIWLRRIAINHQRHRKTHTNTHLLEVILINNLNDTEFFINKAIGWSLRDYSKTNPDWVSDFISRHKNQMHPLSIREASKYLK